MFEEKRKGEMDGVVAKDETLPPGFRFHPTDEELVTYYLTNKITDASFTGRAIADVDLNKSEPWDLPGKAKMGEKEWYFFSLRDRKYPTGVRTNRATNAGYWKTTGKDKEIFNSNTSELVGMKKTLVFYKGRAPRGEKTNWVMHEYRIYSKNNFRTTKDEWVVCRVFQKSAGGKKYPTNQQPRANPYNLDPYLMHPMMQNDGTHFPMGRNYVSNSDLAELSRVLRGSPMNTTLPMQQHHQQQQQQNYPGCFTLSGMNLNKGNSMQPVLRPMQQQQPNIMNHQQLLADHASSSMMTNHVLADTGCTSADMNIGATNRFQTMDPCGDIETYWTPY